ncbi:hypothetical protein HK100_012496 [Physocladia obscura]|uniref:Uncharacterized protein n=1 Tax=Physocladia obscura TaxID=109957 RepID=A0AAD5XD61_9FUNG|nr:hypothetical protein HK100_012496 [Physocladia obscura]
MDNKGDTTARKPTRKGKVHDTNGASEQQGNRQSALAGFGGRILQPDSMDVFAHNAWDNAEWTEEAELNAQAKIAVQKEHMVSITDRELYSKDANGISLLSNTTLPIPRSLWDYTIIGFWDKFYSNHTNSFFMDRHWLKQEFPELFKPVDGSFSGNNDGSRKTVFEIGCGAGNTVRKDATN